MQEQRLGYFCGSSTLPPFCTPSREPRLLEQPVGSPGQRLGGRRKERCEEGESIRTVGTCSQVAGQEGSKSGPGLGRAPVGFPFAYCTGFQ